MSQLGLPATAWTNSGFTRCTSLTRPISPRDGDLIYEIDSTLYRRYQEVTDDWFVLPAGEFGRAVRTTSSSDDAGTGTETPVLRLDDIVLFGGCKHVIQSSGMIVDSDTVGDVVAVRYRATFDGSVPTISSPLFGGIQHTVTAAAGQVVSPIIRNYEDASTQMFSILLSFQRVSGSGIVKLTATTGFPIDITVLNHGTFAENAGVDL